MRSVRARLTWWYAVALTAAVGAFGVTLYLMRRRPTIAELDNRLAVEARVSVRHLTSSYRVLGSLVVSQPVPALDASIASFLESFPDFLIVTDTGGRVLFASDTVRALPFSALEPDDSTRLRVLAVRMEGALYRPGDAQYPIHVVAAASAAPTDE